MSTVIADTDGGWHPSSFAAGHQSCLDEVREILSANVLRGKPAATVAALSLLVMANELGVAGVIEFVGERIAPTEPDHGTARFTLLASKADIPPGAA